MQLTITIDLDNAAFTNEDDGTPYVGPEVARILAALAHRADEAITAANLDGITLWDYNGNRVGTTAIGVSDD